MQSSHTWHVENIRIEVQFRVPSIIVKIRKMVAITFSIASSLEQNKLKASNGGDVLHYITPSVDLETLTISTNGRIKDVS
jgi:hypothetical protein